MGNFEMVEYSKTWTWEEIKLVQDFAAKGFTAKAIAAELVGRTRFSVIGMCNRRGIKLLNKIEKKKDYKRPLPLKAKKKKANYNIKKTDAVRLEPTIIKEIEPENFEPLNKKIMDLRYSDCRAIIGPVKGMETLYCGHKTLEGKSWCGHHHMMYTTTSKYNAA
jgi:hypothetical protein